MPSPITYTVERLCHFRCGACQGWWTIGDWKNEGSLLHCPHCGNEARAQRKRRHGPRPRCPSRVTMLPDGRMDTKNAAMYVGLSEQTLAMMRSSGRGPVFVKRGRVFYFRDDLDAWIDSTRTESSSQMGR